MISKIILSSSDCDEVEVVATCLDATKVPDDLKKDAPSINCAIQLIIEEEDAEEIKGMLNSVSVLNQVAPEDMTEEQKKDPILGLVCPYATAGEKLKSSAITKVKSKSMQKYLLNLTDSHLNRKFCIVYTSVMIRNTTI